MCVCLFYIFNDIDTWRGVIGRNCLPEVSLSGVLLLDSKAKVTITNTMFEYGMCCRLMIDFVILASDLQPYVLDAQVMSWIKY